MTEQNDWWTSFFPTWAEIQRHSKTEEQTRAEADCIENLLDVPPQSHVLDVPCGGGRLSLAMASLGYRVTGVDITRPFLEEARRKAAEGELEVCWEHRDMRDLPWQEEFDGAFCFWGSFGYFDEAGNLEFLRAVHRALKPGARFLLETQIAETLLPRFQERVWDRYGDTLLLQERRYDHLHSRIDAVWTFIRDGQAVERASSIRIYTYRELCQLLEAAGFRTCEGYDSLSDKPFRLGATRLLLLAAKRS